MMLSTAASPTPFTAPMPKRMFFRLSTLNFSNDSFTSGPNTEMPIALHSSMNFVISTMLLKLRLNTAAMYSDGKLALR